MFPLSRYSRSFLFGCKAICGLAFGFYFFNINKINRSYYEIYKAGKVSLRKLPYPYRAALSICSDIDGTDTAEKFIEIQRFLNTKAVTKMGKGVGLEIGNSFFMYERGNRFSFNSGRLKDRRVISKFIHSGILDCLHSAFRTPNFALGRICSWDIP